MKVKLKVQKETERGPHGAGCVVEVDDNTGKKWITAGHAEPLKPDPIDRKPKHRKSGGLKNG